MTEWTEQDSLRLTAFLVLDGHRLRLTREEKRAVVLLAREMGLTREQAAHRCGVKHHTFVQWALRTGVEYPLPAQTVEAWARAYVRPRRHRRPGRHAPAPRRPGVRRCAVIRLEIDTAPPVIRCGARRGPRSRVTCEMPALHGYGQPFPGSDWHCGRSWAGRWFSWRVKL